MSLEVKNDQEFSASDSESMSSEGSDGYESDDFLNPDFASILGAQQRIASQKTPTALYGLVVPAGGEIVPLIDDGELPHAIRLTMAAIDVSDGENSTKACTVKVIRRPVFEDDGEDDDDEIDEEEIAMYTDEFVLCTLKPGVIYQQPLDLSFSEGEVVLFTTTGDCDVHLSGNYMTPVDEPNGAYDSEDEDDEDEEYDSEENELLEQLAEEAESEDELDDIDARISELEEAEAEPVKTNKKRRASAEADVEMDQVDEEPKVEKKLSKKERKKLKNAAGEAAAAPAQEEKQAAEDSAKKSVSFSNDTKAPSKTSVNGVGIEDRKTGEGPSAKNGSRVSIRYVGKLKNGKQFDSNTKGKPFAFKVGQGEVIKGMDAGLIGMKAGGERRLEVPAAMAYAGQSLPGIPANSDLIFDIKLLKFN